MTEKNELSISEALRKGREARGETIEQVQQKLGVSLRILQGIEAGDYDVVEPIYARLAIWHYAEHVGLGGDAMAARFTQEIGLPEEPVAMRTDDPSPVPVASASPLITFLQRQPLSRLLGAVVLLIALLVAAAALLGNNSSDEQSYDAPADYLSSPLVVDASASERGSSTPAPSSSRTPDKASPTAETAVTQVMPVSDGRDADVEATPASPGPGEVSSAQDDAGSLSSPSVAPEDEPELDASLRQTDAGAPELIRPQQREQAVESNRVAAEDGDPERRNSGPSVEAQTPGPGDDDVGNSSASSPAADGSAPSGAVPAGAVPTSADNDQSRPDSATPPVSGSERLAAVSDTQTSAAPVVRTDGAIVLEARAIDSTWVQVQWDGIDGIEEIIPQGEVRRWTADRFFMVRAGRAHGVHFRLQGRLLGDGRLGDATRVLRFRGLVDGYQLLGPELESLGDFTPLSPPEPATESVDTERP